MRGAAGALCESAGGGSSSSAHGPEPRWASPVLSAPPPILYRRAKVKLDRLRRRGKAPPKKGAGKRSGKK